MSYENHEVWIKTNRPQFILTLGHRGFGKSVVDEYIAEGLYKHGWTILDLWGADNLENLFWCVNLNHKKENEIAKLENPTNPNLNECNCHKSYPITVLCPEYIEWDQKSLDYFNGIYFTKEEWAEKQREIGEVLIEYDRTTPPRKPESQIKTPRIRIIKLPTPTKKNNTNVNRELVRKFTEAVLEAREERRIVCFNPKMFPDETPRFKTLELILRAIENITFKYFTPSPSQPRKNYHRMAIIMREFGEITASSYKADSSGDSLLVKKALLKFIRLSRHYNVSLIGDAQRDQDIHPSIREQTDIMVIKYSSDRLLGDSLRYVADMVEKQQNKIIERYGNSEMGKKIAKERYPLVSTLRKNQAYIIWQDDFFRLRQIPLPTFHHKQPDDHWSRLTQVYFNIPEITESTTKDSQQSSQDQKTNDKLLYTLIFEKRSPKTGKPAKWDGVKDFLAELQQKGEVSYLTKFSEMPTNTLQQLFRRLQKKYEPVIQASNSQ